MTPKRVSASQREVQPPQPSLTLVERVPGSTIGAGSLFQGHYEILAKLGQGGFAAVYQARQVATGQLVAIKIMRSGIAGDHSRRVARFQREIRLCARLHHPNIVRLIDSGHTPEGLLYTVFEFVPGENLADVLAREGALDPREARHLMLQVLDALCCAHAQGVVHRDIKPANIMVVPTGARRNAMVLDFGIGALVDAMAGPSPNKTVATNEVVCTPGYAAPEQIKAMRPTARSDLYAWGLVFLESLTGKPAITGGSLQEVLLKQMSSAPVPIPRPLWGHPLGELLREALVKDVRERNVDAEGLFWRLQACKVNGLRRESFLEPAARRAQRSQTTLPLRPRASGRGLALVPSKRPSEADRRQLTALCYGLTALGPGPDAMDIEEVEELISREQASCADLVRRHHGRFAGALGDEVLSYFGSDAAPKDGAVSAGRAALELLSRVQSQSARLEAERGIRLEVRIGLHTGLAGNRDMRGPAHALGTTPAIAARLSALAAPDTIVLSSTTSRLLEGPFTLAHGGALPVEGLDRPVEVFLLRGEKGTPS
ncbi:protein kinase domain-containing protein [Polyangium jinanense]|uniref:Protein kinase n=1 Tax=Polyangium jinanense TaxID=2829994 RepID=A0A9X3XET3_9BACT|nr:protein kinase [Polyangium jinanense]MDC3962618.1 protein kinase [Polyangium jinanense]MDC3989054.1 protein kinase [Polyangium jinanense]